MSAFFGRGEEGSEILLSGKTNLHTSPSIVGPSREGERRRLGVRKY